jgi:hypothetical protein
LHCSPDATASPEALYVISLWLLVGVVVVLHFWPQIERKVRPGEFD